MIDQASERGISMILLSNIHLSHYSAKVSLSRALCAARVLTCKNVEKSTILMLNVNADCQNIDDCYRISKKKVKFEGDEKYYCEKCQKKRIASQRKEITQWPKNLIVWFSNHFPSMIKKYSCNFFKTN